MDKKIVAILLLSLLFRVGEAYESPIRWWDETVYGSLALQLRENPLDYSYRSFGDFIPNGPQIPGFRPPLLSYLLALWPLPMELLMPLVGAAGVFLVYFLVRPFGEKAALFSAALLAFLPLHAYYSGKMLNDVLALTLLTASAIPFLRWNKSGHKKQALLCGLLCGLAILARYPSGLILVVYAAYVLLYARKRIRGLLPLFSGLLLPLLPWFYYSQLQYGSVWGFLLHGLQASTFWGGEQPWFFLFQYFPQMFAGALVAFLLALRMKRRQETTLLLFWFAIFLLFATLSPHKEDRYLMPIVLPIVILGGTYLAALPKKRSFLAPLLVALTVLPAISQLGLALTDATPPEIRCFFGAKDFLLTTPENALVYTDSSPIIYYYTQRETRFVFRHSEPREDRQTYYLWSKYDRSADVEENAIFSCPADGSLAKIYGFS